MRYFDKLGPIPDERLDFYDGGKKANVSPESEARMDKFFKEQRERIAKEERQEAEKATRPSKSG